MIPISVFTAAILKSTPRVDREASTNAEKVVALCEVSAEAKSASFQVKAKISTAVTTRPSTESGNEISDRDRCSVNPLLRELRANGREQVASGHALLAGGDVALDREFYLLTPIILRVL